MTSLQVRVGSLCIDVAKDKSLRFGWINALVVKRLLVKAETIISVLLDLLDRVLLADVVSFGCLDEPTPSSPQSHMDVLLSSLCPTERVLNELVPRENHQTEVPNAVVIWHARVTARLRWWH
jgi:hypothetical protein